MDGTGHRQDTFRDAFCHDLDDTESLIVSTTQRPLARHCFEDVTQEPAWKTKPSWYQVSAQDRMIPPQTQRKMAERIHARETIELDTSHASFATRPTQVLELITTKWPWGPVDRRAEMEDWMAELTSSVCPSPHWHPDALGLNELRTC